MPFLNPCIKIAWPIQINRKEMIKMIALDQIHQDNIDPNSTDVVQYPGPGE